MAIRTIRPGVMGSAGTVLVLTVNGGGTFTLSHSSTTSSGMAENVATGTLEAQVGTILGISASNVHATKAMRPEGFVFTITFDPSVNPTLAAAITTNGAGLTAQNEVQQVDVVNANGGTFVLTFGGQGTAPINYNADPTSGSDSVRAKLVALSSIGGSGVTVSGSSGHYTITFGGGTLAGTNVGDLAPDASQLTGALTNGNLASSATFTVSITNGSAIISSITLDGVASVTQSTTQDGGRGIGVGTPTPGAPDEVQTVSGFTTAFTLSFGGFTTASIATTATAATVQAALEALSSIGAGNVLVTGGSGSYTVKFRHTLGGTNVAQMTTSSGTVATTTQGATGGSEPRRSPSAPRAAASR